MHLDRLFFEREGLFFENHLVVVHLGGIEVRGALRIHQRPAEVGVDFCHVVGGPRRDVGGFVVDQRIEGLECRVHARLLFLEALLEWLDELHRAESLIEALRQDERGLCSEIPDARGAGTPGLLVDFDDLS